MINTLQRQLLNPNIFPIPPTNSRASYGMSTAVGKILSYCGQTTSDDARSFQPYQARFGYGIT
jgi:hypothetical protein